jgi:hypothetical protein
MQKDFFETKVANPELSQIIITLSLNNSRYSDQNFPVFFLGKHQMKNTTEHVFYLFKFATVANKIWKK